MKKVFLYHSKFNSEAIAVIAYSSEEAVKILIKQLELMSRIIKDDYILMSSCKCEVGEIAVATEVINDV